MNLFETMAGPTAEESAGFQLAALSGFDAARASSIRGYIYMPTLDTSREIDNYSRLELMRRARWLVQNTGLGTRCVEGPAQLVVGRGLKPFPMTEDEDWNREVTRRFYDVYGSPDVFDVAGEVDFCSAQFQIMRSVFEDGELFGVLAHAKSKLARVQLYEAHQVGTGTLPRGEDAKRWQDGILTDANNRAIKYRFLFDDAKEHMDVDRANVFHVKRFHRFGAKHGVTALRHAANHMLDRTELLAEMKFGAKKRNRWGLVMEGQTSTRPGIELGAPRRERVEVAGDTPKGGGAPPAREAEVLVEDVIKEEGGVVKIPKGKTLKFMESEQPSQGEIELLWALVQDIAWGLGIAPELLWRIEKLGGANTRFIMDDAQVFVERWQEYLADAFVIRFWIFFVASEMKFRGLGEPKGNAPWWAVGVMPPPRRTVDFGRDGNVQLRQMAAGYRTAETHYNELGRQWDREFIQFNRELVFRARDLKAQAEAAGMDVDEVLAINSFFGFKEPRAEVAEAAASAAEEALATGRDDELPAGAAAA